jgi:AcrR family transcriptional regulator
MKRRSVKFDSIAGAAKKLFWKHGISRVTVEEICREAGVSKMTCYKYFKNKTAIAKHIIDDLTENAIAEYHEIYDSNIPYSEKVKKTIELKLRSSGEFSQELINDIYKSDDPELREIIDTVMKKAMDLYLGDLKRAQKNGDIRPDIKPEFILYIINQMTETITDERLTALYPDPAHLVAEMMNHFFFGILSGKEKGIR